ncbi:hypothetical protein [Phosphitispora fastidiosa]|uniref:hypothetical protein n=1 Tax=Phosphitispora fastidiosa TaxID=2837202 RepID=UPI001E620720|nr:hypothetical protein [Phosphitispora fastidiosa]MBU7007652.1 hypothetical protein [Phosphitispora fastidiosa]
MSAFITMGIGLILLVSFTISAYITFQKFSIRSSLTRVAVFLALAVILSVVTFTISLTIYYT